MQAALEDGTPVQGAVSVDGISRGKPCQESQRHLPHEEGVCVARGLCLVMMNC